jgi:hypothetical protein
VSDEAAERERDEGERTWKNQQQITRDEMRRSDEYQQAYRTEADLREAAEAALAAARAALRELLEYVPERGATLRAGYGNARRRAVAAAGETAPSEPDRGGAG